MSIHLFPLSVTGERDPIKSIDTFSKGVLMIGIFCNGARLTLALFTVRWQMSQEAHKRFTSPQHDAMKYLLGTLMS